MHFDKFFYLLVSDPWFPSILRKLLKIFVEIKIALKFTISHSIPDWCVPYLIVLYFHLLKKAICICLDNFHRLNHWAAENSSLCTYYYTLAGLVFNWLWSEGPTYSHSFKLTFVIWWIFRDSINHNLYCVIVSENTWGCVCILFEKESNSWICYSLFFLIYIFLGHLFFVLYNYLISMFRFTFLFGYLMYSQSSSATIYL